MLRLDRLQAILLQIQSKKVITAKEIADQFEISIRTVYRDIRALEEAGVPIGAEAGLGYFLDENYNLPPVMFSQEEASALVVAGKLMPYLSDKLVQQAFQNALLKVKAILRTDQKESLEVLEHTVKVYAGNSGGSVSSSIYLQDLQLALVEKRIVALDYRSNYKQQESSREVEPIGLVFYAMNWHLIAYCQLRCNYRDFRLDRIKKLRLTNQKYERNLGKAFDEYLQNEKENANYFEISFWCPQQLSKSIQDSKYWYGFINEVDSNGGKQMNFINSDLDGFTRWLVSLGAGVRNIQPQLLKDKVFEHIDAFIQDYKIDIN